LGTFKRKSSLYAAILFCASIFVPITIPGDNSFAATSPITITAPSSVNITGIGGPVCPPSGKTGCPLSVAGLTSGNYLVAIKIGATVENQAQLKITSQGSVVLSYGYSSSNLNGFTEISFTGTATAINNALSHLEYISNNFAGEASLTITATENIPGVAYYAKDDHFYKVGHFGDGYVDEGKFCSASNFSTLSYISNYSTIETLSNNFSNTSVLGWAPKVISPVIPYGTSAQDQSETFGLGSIASINESGLLNIFYHNDSNEINRIFDAMQRPLNLTPFASLLIFSPSLYDEA
jgi:hypothetical protein